MSQTDNRTYETSEEGIRIERTFPRFTIGQRWEHAILLMSVLILLATGLVQKYRTSTWSQNILATPERLELIQKTHHIAAVLLIAEVIYHLGHTFYLLGRRRLSGRILPTWKDFKDAFQMLKYLLFLSRKKPEYWKYSFEQKFTYWFIFFAIGIMIISGLIIWFPITFTRFLPGEIIPAAKLAHSTEALIAGIFIVVWHFFHVLIERLNLSIFTGRLSESEMKTYHTAEYRYLVEGSSPDSAKSEGGKQ
jgi:formate dehydrogenase subunit gamma